MSYLIGFGVGLTVVLLTWAFWWAFTEDYKTAVKVVERETMKLKGGK